MRVLGSRPIREDGRTQLLDRLDRHGLGLVSGGTLCHRLIHHVRDFKQTLPDFRSGSKTGL